MESELIHKKSRAFNEVVVDKKRAKVIKRSTDFLKLCCEASWYVNLPDNLQPFVPKFLDSSIPFHSDEKGSIELEYCPYPTLAELFVSNAQVDWKRILTRLLEVHELFQNQTVNPSLEDDLRTFHLEKTRSRFQELEKIPILQNVLKAKELMINGEIYKNINLDQILEDLQTKLCYLKISVVHGDYCFSNILYDVASDSVKLIDPRGYLNDKNFSCIYGDSNYDFAKLMHSVHGLYDYIVAGKYSLIQTSNNAFSFDIHKQMPIHLLCFLRDSSPDMRVYAYRCLLEVLLFLTMIPLHWEDSRRQLAFYLRAVQLYRSYLTVN